MNWKNLKLPVTVLQICCVGAIIFFSPPAFADSVETFNFNLNLGDIGKTDLLKDGAVQFLISGFNVTLNPGDIWEKNLGPTETGLGLAQETNHEIGKTQFLQIDISKLTADKQIEAVAIGVNSIQPGESYNIYGSNAAGMLGTLIAANQTDPNFVLPLAPFQFISITADSGNVLLQDVAVTTTPEPSTFLLLIAGAIIAAGVSLRKKVVA